MKELTESEKLDRRIDEMLKDMKFMKERRVSEGYKSKKQERKFNKLKRLRKAA